MRILVVGATGMLGEPVARQLHTHGHCVRLLARQPDRTRARFGPGFETAGGDVTQPDTLANAVRGCDVVHINLRGTNTVASYAQIELQGTRNVAHAARAAGVGRISYVSGAGDLRRAPNSPFARIKLGAEQAIVDSGLPYTVFKPTHFMESLPMFVRDGRATIIGRQPHRYHYLAARDFAEIVACALANPVDAGRSLTVFGPRAWTMHEALAVYCRICRPEVRVDSVPLWLFRALAALRRNQDMRFAALLFDAFSRIGEGGDPARATELLGRAPITLEQWCHERAAAAATPA